MKERKLGVKVDRKDFIQEHLRIVRICVKKEELAIQEGAYSEQNSILSEILPSFSLFVLKRF